MPGSLPNQHVYPEASPNEALSGRVRSDLETMLLPFFPEDLSFDDFTTEIGGYTVSMRTTDPDGRIATAGDRKILNILAARIGATIRAGKVPSRHIEVSIKDIVDDITCDRVTGGSDHLRVGERLERLAATWITTEMPIGDDVSRRRNFRWIDAWEVDVQETPGVQRTGLQRIKRLKISLSIDAFRWITRNEGFDISAERFHALTASRSSSWRIYEICLAKLVRNGGVPTRIAIDDLRRRIPIASELKLFRARTLKSSMQSIAENAQMSRVLRLSLVRKTDSGFEPVVMGKRTLLDTLYVEVTRGPDPLPETNRLIPDGASPLVDTGEPLDMEADEVEQPLLPPIPREVKMQRR